RCLPGHFLTPPSPCFARCLRGTATASPRQHPTNTTQVVSSSLTLLSILFGVFSNHQIALLFLIRAEKILLVKPRSIGNVVRAQSLITSVVAPSRLGHLRLAQSGPDLMPAVDLLPLHQTVLPETELK